MNSEKYNLSDLMHRLILTSTILKLKLSIHMIPSNHYWNVMHDT